MNYKPVKQTVLIVAAANLAYFFIEFFSALNIHSVSLLADSIDFLEDASVNFLIFFAIGWSMIARSRVGMILAGFIIIPAVATLLAIYHQITVGHAPKPVDMSSRLPQFSINFIKFDWVEWLKT
jgi:Co/Zn/Cd efflux system component